MTQILSVLLMRHGNRFGSVVPEAFLKKPHRKIDFTGTFLGYLKSHPELKLGTKDITDPDTCAELVQKIHKELGMEWTYGDWLANRSKILQESYLKMTKSWIHLGIDINLPVGTPVRAATDGVVHMADSDYPEEGGWGNFVLLEHELEETVFYSISGHLSEKHLAREGQKISRGEVIGQVGHTNENGFWFPHLHFQFISAPEMRLKENPFTLDGYGKAEDIPYLKKHYPNPLSVLRM